MLGVFIGVKAQSAYVVVTLMELNLGPKSFKSFFDLILQLPIP
jgi:hypothetical protein